MTTEAEREWAAREGAKAYKSAKDCRLCGEVTDCSFNIAFERVSVCESCARAITLQQIRWWAEQPVPK